ncbi:unnamed protein product [Choristocarpus tenellus]
MALPTFTTSTTSAPIKETTMFELQSSLSSRRSALPGEKGDFGELTAEREKSEASRRKRDQFLDQMSSFLQNIESQATTRTAPVQSPWSANSSAGLGYRSPDLEEMGGSNRRHPYPSKYVLPTLPSPEPDSVSVGGVSSSLMQEVLLDDAEADNYSGGEGTVSKSGVLQNNLFDQAVHPRGCLFDDDVGTYMPSKDNIGGGKGTEETRQDNKVIGALNEANQMSNKVLAPPHPQAPQESSMAEANSKPQSKPKPKSRGGINLQESRRRTTLLSSASAPVRPLTTSQHVHIGSQVDSAEGSPNVSKLSDQKHLTKQSLSPPKTTSLHPLDPGLDPLRSNVSNISEEKGNFFNDELLKDRMKESTSKGELTAEQGEYSYAAREGESLFESAGSLLSTAREGASTLMRDAKAGVGVMGASVGWPQQPEGSVEERQLAKGKAWREIQGATRGWNMGSYVNSGMYEVTFGEGRLGFTLLREEEGRSKAWGVVCRVQPDGIAHSLGVREGDILCGINKRRFDTYDHIMEVLPTLPRPVLIAFCREKESTQAGSTDDAQMSTSPAKAPVATPTYKMQQATQADRGPLEWFSKLDPFKTRPVQGEELSKGSDSGLDYSWQFFKDQQEHPGEARARVLGGVFSWSYYGPSDGLEPVTNEMYTEHIMRCQWGHNEESMSSWMVARRYREFDALDKDLREAFPHRANSFPNIPPKELFKTSPDVVERRVKGLEQYMINIIRKFPDLLETHQMNKFLTISDRVATLRLKRETGNSKDQGKGYHQGGDLHEISSGGRGQAAKLTGESALVGTDFILNLMSSEEAYRVSQSQHSHPVDVQVAEDLAAELSNYVDQLSPMANIFSDVVLYDIIERCTSCWPRLKATAAAHMSDDSIVDARLSQVEGEEKYLERVLQCDEDMEHAFEKLKTELAARGS